MLIPAGGKRLRQMQQQSPCQVVPRAELGNSLLGPGDHDLDGTARPLDHCHRTLLTEPAALSVLLQGCGCSRDHASLHPPPGILCPRGSCPLYMPISREGQCHVPGTKPPQVASLCPHIDRPHREGVPSQPGPRLRPGTAWPSTGLLFKSQTCKMPLSLLSSVAIPRHMHEPK